MQLPRPSPNAAPAIPRRDPLHLLAGPGRPLRRQRRIHVGEVVVSAEPLLLQTLLGSCVAVCLHDPHAGVGGMNHILLPSGGNPTLDPHDRASRFGVHAMELLINRLMARGGDRRRCVARAFGAGNVLARSASPTVGERNARFVREFLAAERIPLIAQRLGGTQPVQVHFRTDTGRTLVQSVDGSRLSAIVHAESRYNLRHLAHPDFTGEATLF